MTKTLPKLYDAIIEEATRLHLSEGLDWEAAFAKAIPRHFHRVAEEEWKLPSMFVELVWHKVNEVSDRYHADKFQMELLLVEMQLTTSADRQRVWRALKRLRSLGLVHNPTDRSWARVKNPQPTINVRALIEIASAAAD